jgi:hypothetical protein
MNKRIGPIGWGLLLFCLAMAPAWPALAIVRVATYNIDDDTGGGGTDQRTPMADLLTVLQGIGNHHLSGHAQPLDVLALQELHYDNPLPSVSLGQIVTQLNSVYGAGTYAYDPYVGDTTGNLAGNGPNGLIYNTHTIKVLNALGIGSASSLGAPRQPIRYKLHPLGYLSGADFFLYDSHYKASGGSSNEDRRTVEADEIRADADALGAGLHAIYAGDFNLTGASAETAYQDLIAAGNGQAYDPASPTNSWSNDSSHVALETESSTSLSARFDFQLITNPVRNQNGLQLLSGTYEVFGNNGTTAYHGATDASGNTALGDLSNRTTVLHLLTTVTDHLPVVADYDVVGIAVPEPASLGLLLFAGLVVRRRRARCH